MEPPMRAVDRMDDDESERVQPALHRPQPLAAAVAAPLPLHARAASAASPAAPATAPMPSRSIFAQQHATSNAVMHTPTKHMAGLSIAAHTHDATEASASPLLLPMRAQPAHTADTAGTLRARQEQPWTDGAVPRSAPGSAPSPAPSPSPAPAPAPFTAHARSRTHSFLSPNEDELSAAAVAAEKAELGMGETSAFTSPPAHDKPQAKKIKAYHSSPGVQPPAAHSSNHAATASSSAHSTPVQRAQESSSSFASPLSSASPPQRGIAGALGLSIALPQAALHSPFVMQTSTAASAAAPCSGTPPTHPQHHSNSLLFPGLMSSPPFAPALPPTHSTSQTPDGRSSKSCSFSRAPWGASPTPPGRSSSHMPSATAAAAGAPQHHHSASCAHLPASLLSRASSTVPFNHPPYHSHQHHPSHPSQQTGQHLYDGAPVRINVPVPGGHCDAATAAGATDAAADDDDDCPTDTDEDDSGAGDPGASGHVMYKPLLPTIKNHNGRISVETMMELLRSIQATGGTFDDLATGAGCATTPRDPCSSPESSPPSCASPPSQCASASHLPGGQFSSYYSKLIIIDARWPYEFAGGHIRGATNLWKPDQLWPYFLGAPPASMAEGQRICVVFHCEYSQQRGPQLFDKLRGADREIHAWKHEWSNLFYPEMYVLQGGYKSFFETFGPQANSVVNTPRNASSTPGPYRNPSPLPSYRSIGGGAAAAAAAAGESIVRSESVPLQDGAGYGNMPQSARAHKPLSSAAANRLRPHAKSSGASVQSTAAAAAVASSLSPRAFACTSTHRASSPFSAGFQSIAAATTPQPQPSSRQLSSYSAAFASAASPLTLSNGDGGNTMEDTPLSFDPATAAETQSAPVSSGAETPSGFSAFNPASASYVTMFDPRFVKERLQHHKERETDKRSLTRSASVGTMGGAHASAAAAAAAAVAASGSATPLPPSTAPPTPPTRPESSLEGGSSSGGSPFVCGSGSGGASGLPSPLVMPARVSVSMSGLSSAAASSTGLTPRMSSTSLNFGALGSPNYGAALPSPALHDPVDSMRDELSRRRRSLSLSNSSQNRSAAGTPMLLLSQSSVGSDANTADANAAAGAPSTPVLQGRALPPTGRDLMASLTATLSTQQQHQQQQQAPGSPFVPTGLLFSPIANSGGGVSARSPRFVRSASLSDASAAAAAGGDASMLHPLHSLSMGLPYRPRQSPSPTSRGLFSSAGSSGGSAVASPSSRAVSGGGGFGFGGALSALLQSRDSQSSIGSLSGYSSLNSSSASLNQFGSPLQLGLSGSSGAGSSNGGPRSSSAAPGGGGGGGSSNCSPIFAGVQQTWSPRAQGRGSPHVPQHTSHPPLPPSPPHLEVRSRSDFSSVNQAKRASASSASIQAAAAAVALHALEKARLLSGTPVIPECSPAVFDESGVALPRSGRDSPSLSRVAGSSPPPLLPQED